MPEPTWQQAVEAIAPYVIRISTPEHAGTGVLFAFGAQGGILGFATAAHVLAHAHLWQQPIRIEHGESGWGRLVKFDERALVFDEDTDMVKACLRLVRFFARESCGKCTPCREGTSWMETVSYTHLRAHETVLDLVCRLLLEKKKT